MASDTTTERREIQIVAGVHHGATFALSEDDLLVIGSDVTCDICLTDEGIAARHAALTLRGQCVSIRRLDGPVTVDEQTLAPSERATLQPGAGITLGQTGVRLQLNGVPPARPATERQDGRSTQRSLLRRGYLPGAILVVVVFAALAAQKINASRADRANETDRPAAAVTQQPNPGEDLVEQTRAVFRTNGYEAEVTYLGKGRVRIENLDESNDRVQSVLALVRADVPQLAGIEFTPADNSKPPASPSRFLNAPVSGMRVIVEEDMAYLASADGARYFVGSLLPNGYAVRRITRDGVQVDRNGQISWMRF